MTHTPSLKQRGLTLTSTQAQLAGALGAIKVRSNGDLTITPFSPAAVVHLRLLAGHLVQAQSWRLRLDRVFAASPAIFLGRPVWTVALSSTAPYSQDLTGCLRVLPAPSYSRPPQLRPFDRGCRVALT